MWLYQNKSMVSHTGSTVSATLTILIPTSYIVINSTEKEAILIMHDGHEYNYSLYACLSKKVGCHNLAFINTNWAIYQIPVTPYNNFHWSVLFKA